MVEYPQCHVLVPKKLRKGPKNKFTHLLTWLKLVLLGVSHEPQNDGERGTPFPGKQSKVQKVRTDGHTERASWHPMHPQGLTPADEEVT